MKMNPRERWLAVLEGRKPDRIPTDYWATGEFHAKLKQHLGITEDEQVWQALQIDRPCMLWPKQTRAHHPADPQADIWGIRYATIEHATGSYGEAVHHPLGQITSVEEIEAFAWPDPAVLDLTDIPATIERNAGYRIIQGGHYEPFLLYCAMRGMEQAYEDLLIQPVIVEAALARIFDFCATVNVGIWEAGCGQIDFMYLAEDLGGQTGPLFSLDVYRRLILPGQRKMAALARRHGVRAFYHTDGAARIFLPDLVNDVGIQILNPLQWRCPGMEREGLVSDYGRSLVFHGGIDNQQTLPFGTPEDVRREVRECAAIFRDARWICAPCHNIQNVTPVENVLAMYQTIQEVR